MRLIDADALINTLNKEKIEFNADINYFILNAPTIDAEPVRHGHWIYFEQDNMFGCSKCARWMPRNNYLYCPWCGARMNEVNDE